MGAETVVWLRREDNEDGETRIVARVRCPGCAVQPEPAAETYDSGQTVRQRVRVFAPADSPLARAQARDAVEVEGWHVGQPDPVQLPLTGTPSVLADRHTARPHHVELAGTYSAG